MKKVLLSLFVAFTLLLAPIAHAFDVNYEVDNCHMSGHIKKESKSASQQDNDKMANASHHCCCPHVSAIPDLAVALPIPNSSQTIFFLEYNDMLSIVVGSPLKPPSHV